MLCGYCKTPASGVSTLYVHWRASGCPRYRPVWARVVEARRRGSSGRRILAEAFPNVYKSEPMDEETKEKLREITERRKAEGIKPSRRRR